MGNRWRLDAYGVLTDEDLLVSGTVPSDRVSTGVVARPLLPPRLGTSPPGPGSLPGGGEGGVAVNKHTSPAPPDSCFRTRKHAASTATPARTRPVAAERYRSQGHRSVLWANNGRALRQPALFGLGVTYTTAAQLSSTLNRCDFHFSIDISDAYHLSLWAGCGGALQPIKRPIITSHWPVP